MPWIPESQRDTRWYLWNPMFMCRVSNIQSMSTDYIRHFGMPSSGIEEYDRQTANELVVRMLTINDMVEYFKNAVTIRVVNRADTKTIYEYISNHLQAWRRELENGFHTRGAPLEELQTLDRFANVVYEHAQWHFDKPFIESLFARQLSDIVGVTRDTILTKQPGAVTINADPNAAAEERPGRVSMAEIFASREAAAKAKWR